MAVSGAGRWEQGERVLAGQAAHAPSVAGDSGDQSARVSGFAEARSARVSGFADRASASEYRSKFVRTQDFTRVRVTLGSHRGGEQGVCGLRATAGVRVLMVSHGIYGDGNGNPLQYSCLENPMDEGAR